MIPIIEVLRGVIADLGVNCSRSRITGLSYCRLRASEDFLRLNQLSPGFKNFLEKALHISGHTYRYVGTLVLRYWNVL